MYPVSEDPTLRSLRVGVLVIVFELGSVGTISLRRDLDRMRMRYWVESEGIGSKVLERNVLFTGKRKEDSDLHAVSELAHTVTCREQ